MQVQKIFPNDTYGWINVKDDANAHIQAYEIASASGRYCLVERVARYFELAKILRVLYPTYQVPKKYNIGHLFESGKHVFVEPVLKDNEATTWKEKIGQLYKSSSQSFRVVVHGSKVLSLFYFLSIFSS
ncbi:hypothetical protein RJT34_16915 [Clitoria ternatea]|uniref:Uncharacterized protein n=1 Tax=Clitoria ternatea TaxID=43366 RepID=A0AAN9PE71_CLITE